jgi:hypothetical protein
VKKGRTQKIVGPVTAFCVKADTFGKPKVICSECKGTSMKDNRELSLPVLHPNVCAHTRNKTDSSDAV